MSDANSKEIIQTNIKPQDLELLKNKRIPKVFISYAWEDERHRQWVKELANYLMANGIDATLDQYDLSLGDRLPKFMEKSISESDFVLIICTPTYKEKSDNRQGGVGYEGHIISSELVNSKNERKFIPVIRKGDLSDCMPYILAGKLAIDLRDGEDYSKNLVKLLDTLHGIKTKPSIGDYTIIKSSQYLKTMDSVDIVFCIDGTESKIVLDQIRERIVRFYQDIRFQLERKMFIIGKVRVRLILFGDYQSCGGKAMLVTDFFDLPLQTSAFDMALKSISTFDGDNDAEDGLEALAYAIKSDWYRETNNKRQIIILWSHKIPHDLGFGREVERYPKGMALNFEELTQWWNDENLMDQSAKRLILFTPYRAWWKTISDRWNNVICFPISEGDELMNISDRMVLASIIE